MTATAPAAILDAPTRQFYLKALDVIEEARVRYVVRSIRGLLELEPITIAAVHGSAVGAALGSIIFGMVLIGLTYTTIDQDWYLVFLGGMLLMAWNVVMTVRSATTSDDPTRCTVASIDPDVSNSHRTSSDGAAAVSPPPRGPR